MDDADISQFCAITAASPDVARGFLEMAEGNIESAIQLFFENPDIQSSFSAAPATAGTPGPGLVDQAPPVPNSTRPNIGRQDERGVIHIDSDDDEDTNMTFDDDDDDIQVPDDDEDEVVAVARTAQEEEDAAMAKRLQEELYSETTGVEGVRSPIARTTETLIGSNPFGGHDDNAEMDAMVQHQMLARRRAAEIRNRGGARNPFNHRSIWDDPSGGGAASQSSGGLENGSRAQRLAELFRPPYDLMSAHDWDEARDTGKDEKKWIIVNLQDMSNFSCQALNRDIWKDASIRQLVQENFVFLQYNKDDLRSQQYVNLYFPGESHENPDNYPHVSIIDPRTGEQVKVWSGQPFPTASDFHSQLVEFLDRYSLAANSKNPVAKQTAERPKAVDVERMTEDEMLEMALQNSLAAANGSSPEPKSNVFDPDALTKSPAVSSAEWGGKGKEPADHIDLTGGASSAPAEAAAPTQSVFATISSDNPQTEPENNPATTTRIQFRHPTGRVIRRFTLQDPVRRIYEWLKAEPIDGRAGTEFELKRMPQGQDLIEELEKTIAEAGLKQGTVMVEFIEE